jgi:hypothetical protein
MVIGFLPYLWLEMEMCSTVLSIFLDNIRDFNLAEIAQYYLAKHWLLNHYYECSLYLFEELSQTALCPLIVLFSEMGQARSYHQLVLLGLRTDHDVTHRPNNGHELSVIMNDIMARLDYLEMIVETDINEYDIEPAIVVYDFALLPNHPNPFNPETVIRFQVAADMYRRGLPRLNTTIAEDALGYHSSTHVTIDVFNIRGQRVRGLVSGYLSLGLHSVVWDGRDDRGVQVGSGIYFYRMRAG